MLQSTSRLPSDMDYPYVIHSDRAQYSVTSLTRGNATSSMPQQAKRKLNISEHNFAQTSTRDCPDSNKCNSRYSSLSTHTQGHAIGTNLPTTSSQMLPTSGLPWSTDCLPTLQSRSWLYQGVNNEAASKFCAFRANQTVSMADDVNNFHSVKGREASGSRRLNYDTLSYASSVDGQKFSADVDIRKTLTTCSAEDTTKLRVLGPNVRFTLNSDDTNINSLSMLMTSSESSQQESQTVSESCMYAGERITPADNNQTCYQRDDLANASSYYDRCFQFTAEQDGDCKLSSKLSKDFPYTTGDAKSEYICTLNNCEKRT